MKKMTMEEYNVERYKDLLFDTHENMSELRKLLHEGRVDECINIMYWFENQYYDELVSLGVCPDCGEDLDEVTRLVFDGDRLVENNSYKICHTCGCEFER